MNVYLSVNSEKFSASFITSEFVCRRIMQNLNIIFSNILYFCHYFNYFTGIYLGHAKSIHIYIIGKQWKIRRRFSFHIFIRRNVSSTLTRFQQRSTSNLIRKKRMDITIKGKQLRLCYSLFIQWIKITWQRKGTERWRRKLMNMFFSYRFRVWSHIKSIWIKENFQSPMIVLK